MNINKIIIQTMTSKEVAQLFGIAENTLRKSRTIGFLFGRPTPPYMKKGRFVVYEKDTVENWLSQFYDKKYRSTKD